MAPKKEVQYSKLQIDEMRGKLSGLPDMTDERLRKKDVLDALRDDIKTLMSAKGYTLNEVYQHLQNFGFQDVTLKDLKEITEGKKPRGGRGQATEKIPG